MQIHFKSALWMQVVSPAEYVLSSPFRVVVEDGALHEITVPKGFLVLRDPHAPWLRHHLRGVGRQAAVLHMWLYLEGTKPRAWCDRVMRLALAEQGMPWDQRWFLWAQARLLGWLKFGRKDHG